MKVYRLLPVLALLIVLASSLMAAPAMAAAGGALLTYELNAAACTVDITAQVQDAGFYAINMWDDGTFRAGAGGNILAGGTFTVRFNIAGVILQGAAGIGIYLENGVGTAATATYDADGSAQLWDDTVGTACSAGTWGAVVLGSDACSNPLPSGARVYNVPAGALAFYDDDPNTYAGFNLPPGTWYISEFGEAYAKVWIACEAKPIYIPVENVLR
ncbi:MAG: hypothetical protein JNL42_18830 [Anaerolineae bacterium]|nr:hypothetical protein [Anaerolineae bacterium]